MLAIRRGRKEIGVGLNAISSVRRGLGECLGIERLALERRFHRAGTICLGRNAGHAHSHGLALAGAIKRKIHSHSDHGKSRSGVAHLHIALSHAAFGRGKTDFLQHLARLQRGSEQIDKKIVQLNHALTFAADGDNLRAHRQHRRRPVRSRIRMGQAAADSALVTHLHVAKMGRSFGQQRASMAQQVGSLNLEVRGHGADPNLAAVFTNIRKVLNAANVDQDFGLGQA